jgi:hypothetical protein
MVNTPSSRSPEPTDPGPPMALEAQRDLPHWLRWAWALAWAGETVVVALFVGEGLLLRGPFWTFAGRAWWFGPWRLVVPRGSTVDWVWRACGLLQAVVQIALPIALIIPWRWRARLRSA